MISIFLTTIKDIILDFHIFGIFLVALSCLSLSVIFCLSLKMLFFKKYVITLILSLLLIISGFWTFSIIINSNTTIIQIVSQSLITFINSLFFLSYTISTLIYNWVSVLWTFLIYGLVLTSFEGMYQYYAYFDINSITSLITWL